VLSIVLSIGTDIDDLERYDIPYFLLFHWIW